MHAVNMLSMLRHHVQACLSSLWPKFAYSSFYGSFVGEDVTSDAWNSVMNILRIRWTDFSAQHPERAAIVNTPLKIDN